jgi:Carboxypeptidase regulatory-like domain
VRNHLIFAVGVMLALGNGLSAGQTVIRREEPPRQGPDIERSGVNLVAPWRPAGTNGLTRVVGTVIDIRQIPVPHATVQLRNLDTGTVEQTSESDDEGGYAFEVEESGTYVVEMILVDGYVLALSNAGSLARFETLQTVVQLPGRWDAAARNMIMPQNITTFFGMSAETSMTAGTVELAIDSSIPPANPGVPVSP